MLGFEVTQRLIAVLIVVGLGVGVWLLWPRDDSDTSSTTTPVAAVSTTTGTAEPTTSLEPREPTTSLDDTLVVETVEEAEAILRELWFGWFEGIYHQDEARIREVVASQAMLDAARDAFDTMTFASEPMAPDIHLADTMILRADRDCLVVSTTLTVQGFRSGSSSGVSVMRITDGHWKSFSRWRHEDDLWNQDCDSQLEPLS
jgi:hypothetical protein